MNKKSINATDLFLAILAVLLISVSFWQTWKGLDQVFGTLAFVVALVLSFLLLFLIWEIRKAKTQGKSTTKLVSIYIFIATFCFIANFNAMYGELMREGIYKEELTDINNKYDYLVADVEKKLNYSITDEKTRQQIMSKTQQLKNQIVDTGTPGFGDKARQLASKIEDLLGQKLTLLTVSKNDYADLADRMETQILSMMDQLSPKEKTLKIELKDAKLNWNKQIIKLQAMRGKAFEDVVEGEINKSTQEYNDLLNKSKTILGEDKIKTESAQPKTKDIKKIGFAFTHAFTNFSFYVLVVLMCCILLDFVIVIIVLLVTPTDGEQNGNGSGSVFTGNKRGGKILI